LQRISANGSANQPQCGVVHRRSHTLEEELRLLYVGMTRATEQLVLSAAGNSAIVQRVKNSLEAVAAQFEAA
jgi:ATP-dependent exoDNAse (exonuclease V) beta subunit